MREAGAVKNIPNQTFLWDSQKAKKTRVQPASRPANSHLQRAGVPKDSKCVVASLPCLPLMLNFLKTATASLYIGQI